MSKWQPIETAPKDGTQILAARAGRHVGIVQWSVEEATWENTLDGEGYALLGKNYWPSHWQSLSEPPAAPKNRANSST